MRKLHAITVLLAAGVIASLLWSQPAAQSFPTLEEGRGFATTTVTSDPAANTQISQTVPTNESWRFISATVTFVTSATVANRNPSLVFDDGTNVFARMQARNNITATNTTVLTWGCGLISGTDIVLNVLNMSAPCGTRLNAGYKITTATIGMDATDNYGAMTIYYEKFSAR
jgi:hypothetical protein